MPYPNVLPPPPSEISAIISGMVERQQYNFIHDPLRAHTDSAVLAVCAGTALGAVRGLLSAMLSPSTDRFVVFSRSTRAASVVYVIPFFLGSQFDVMSAVSDRRNSGKREARSRWGLGGDLGGAADMS